MAKRSQEVNIKHAAGILGKRGGIARAEVLTDWKRSAIARKGGVARQHQKKLRGGHKEKQAPI
jgi:hypothetical protein